MCYLKNFIDPGGVTIVKRSISFIELLKMKWTLSKEHDKMSFKIKKQIIRDISKFFNNVTWFYIMRMISLG